MKQAVASMLILAFLTETKTNVQHIELRSLLGNSIPVHAGIQHNQSALVSQPTFQSLPAEAAKARTCEGEGVAASPPALPVDSA